MTTETEFESMTFAVRLGATLFIVLLNGFFVAAEMSGWPYASHPPSSTPLARATDRPLPSA